MVAFLVQSHGGAGMLFTQYIPATVSTSSTIIHPLAVPGRYDSFIPLSVFNQAIWQKSYTLFLFTEPGQTGPVGIR
jgi:hypothetical protein